MKDDPGFKPNSRKRGGTVDASMEYGDAFSRGAGSSMRFGKDYLKRLYEFLSGIDSRSGLVTPESSSDRTAVESETTVTKAEREVMKIQITKYQQADMWEKKEYSVPRTKYDSTIYIHDRPSVIKAMREDSLKYTK